MSFSYSVLSECSLKVICRLKLRIVSFLQIVFYLHSLGGSTYCTETIVVLPNHMTINTA